MSFKKITAIVREGRLQQIKESLQDIGVAGMSVYNVRGFGEYENDYSRDGLVEHIKLELFLSEDILQQVLDVLLDEAHSGIAGDGIITVSPIDELYRIRTKSKMD